MAKFTKKAAPKRAAKKGKPSKKNSGTPNS